MFKVIALNKNGERREYDTKRDCAKNFDMTVKLLVECINDGRERAGWTFDTILNTDCDTPVNAYDADKVLQNVRKRLKAKGVSRNELAEALNISRNKTYFLLSGQSVMRVDNLVDIAKFLNCESLDELYM